MQGVGPNLVTELCELAGVNPALPPEQLQQEDWDRLYTQWRRWLLTISRGTFAAHMDPETGSVSVLSAESAAQTEPEGAPVGSVHELLDGALRSTEVHQSVLLFLKHIISWLCALPVDVSEIILCKLRHGLMPKGTERVGLAFLCVLSRFSEHHSAGIVQGELTFARKKEQLQRAVGNAMSRLRHKMTALQQQQAATEKAEATRKQADLLAANLYKCQRGDREVEVGFTHLTQRKKALKVAGMSHMSS